MTKHLRCHPGVVGALFLALIWPRVSLNETERVDWGINARSLAPLVTPAVAQNHYPRALQMPGIDLGGALQVRYTFDAKLQAAAEGLLKKYKPDYGVLVAIDPDSGKILALANSIRAPDAADIALGNLALVNSFPAASLAKIITAAAAINEGKARAGDVIPFNGKAASLYRKNVYRHKDNKWTRHYTLRESFGKSVNSVFGRLGAMVVGGELLREYARRFGFGGQFASDLDLQNGDFVFDPEDSWQVAEAASGYTERNRISPLHAAALAAGAINGGRLVAPMIIEQVAGPNGVPLYRSQPAVSRVMREDTARELQSLMRATVKRGSARGAFAGFHKGAYKNLIVGGKTGSLSGDAPPGKYDWFVGFARDPDTDKKIAFAALCINKRLWRVKSARLARELVRRHFAPQASA